MLSLHDYVAVVVRGNVVGNGQITDICQSKEELEKYFTTQHPLFLSYLLTARNQKKVYIVEFENNMGLGGYLLHELKKVNKKNHFA